MNDEEYQSLRLRREEAKERRSKVWYTISEIETARDVAIKHGLRGAVAEFNQVLDGKRALYSRYRLEEDVLADQVREARIGRQSAAERIAEHKPTGRYPTS